jgi:hypothetical protein
MQAGAGSQASSVGSDGDNAESVKKAPHSAGTFAGERSPGAIPNYRAGEPTSNSASARHHDPEQERHKQALQRRLPGNGAKSGDRLSRPLRIRDHLAQSVDGNFQRSGDVFDRARRIGRCIDRTLGNARRWNFRCLGAHARRLPCEGKGPPPLAIRASARFSNSGSQATFGYPRQAPL